MDEEAAERQLRRYEAEGKALWGILLAGAFGAFLVELGIIALVAVNWNCFGKVARVGVSALPLAGCERTTVWTRRVAEIWRKLGEIVVPKVEFVNTAAGDVLEYVCELLA